MSSSKERSMKWIVLSTVILVIAAVVIFLATGSSNDEQPQQNIAPISDLAEQPILGDAQAKVTIIEFGDYKCPACKAWSQYVYPEVKKRWIDSGIAKLAYIHTNFHGEESRLGATAGEALWDVQPDAFWTYMKSLYDRQPESSHDDAWITEDVVSEVALQAAPKLDVDAWRTSWTSERIVKRVARDDELVQKFNVQSTPTIIINGTTLNDPFDLDAMQQVIDKAKE